MTIDKGGCPLSRCLCSLQLTRAMGIDLGRGHGGHGGHGRVKTWSRCALSDQHTWLHASSRLVGPQSIEKSPEIFDGWLQKAASSPSCLDNCSQCENRASFLNVRQELQTSQQPRFQVVAQLLQSRVLKNGCLDRAFFARIKHPIFLQTLDVGVSEYGLFLPNIE